MSGQRRDYDEDEEDHYRVESSYSSEDQSDYDDENEEGSYHSRGETSAHENGSSPDRRAPIDDEGDYTDDEDRSRSRSHSGSEEGSYDDKEEGSYRDKDDRSYDDDDGDQSRSYDDENRSRSQHDDDDDRSRSQHSDDRSRSYHDEEQSRSYDDEDRSRSYNEDEEQSRSYDDEDRSKSYNDEDQKSYDDEDRSRSYNDEEQDDDRDRSGSYDDNDDRPDRDQGSYSSNRSRSYNDEEDEYMSGSQRTPSQSQQEDDDYSETDQEKSPSRAYGYASPVPQQKRASNASNDASSFEASSTTGASFALDSEAGSLSESKWDKKGQISKPAVAGKNRMLDNYSDEEDVEDDEQQQSEAPESEGEESASESEPPTRKLPYHQNMRKEDELTDHSGSGQDSFANEEEGCSLQDSPREATLGSKNKTREATRGSKNKDADAFGAFDAFGGSFSGAFQDAGQASFGKVDMNAFDSNGDDFGKGFGDFGKNTEFASKGKDGFGSFNGFNSPLSNQVTGNAKSPTRSVSSRGAGPPSVVSGSADDSSSHSGRGPPSVVSGAPSQVSGSEGSGPPSVVSGAPSQVSGSGGSDPPSVVSGAPSQVSGPRGGPPSVVSGSGEDDESEPDEGPTTVRGTNEARPLQEKKSESGRVSEGPAMVRRSISNGYTRAQMSKLTAESKQASGDLVIESLPHKDGKVAARERRSKAKSESLLALVANVNDAMLSLEKVQEKDSSESKEKDLELSSSRLLHAFEALVGIFLQLSDELELVSTFASNKDLPHREALQTMLSFAAPVNEMFTKLRPILLVYLKEDIGEEMDDFFFGMNLTIELLCELSHRVSEKQQWDGRANTSYVTLLELLARDTIEVECIFDDVDTPDYPVSERLQEAWTATGHVEEIKSLLVTADLSLFRQICYEVMLSTDHWCPDTAILMDICGIEEDMLEDCIKPSPDDELSPTPESALQVLEKIHGEALPRRNTMASIIRRILPPHAVADPSLQDTSLRIRSTIRNPLGLAPSSIVAITSVPEALNDGNALGVAGIGKSTLAGMIAAHSDVRRYFNHGVVWLYIGPTELNYIRYVQCLRDLVAQLEVPEDEQPQFPELLHSPGESTAKRRRREEGFMIYVRDTMVEFLKYRNVLVILDDVCFEPDLDWFDFAPEPGNESEGDDGVCVVLVTTRRRNLLPVADSVEVDMLDADEAVQLLMRESGELSNKLIAEAPETKSVVRECANHPLAIKSVGRWLNLKHATAGAVSSVEEIHEDVVKSMDKILKGGNQDDADMMYEILNMSLAPSINGEPTSIIKFCFAAFVRVFCATDFLSDFALADSTPIVPLSTTESLFEALLDLEEETLLQEGSLFYSQKKEASTLIPEALSALGVFKVITTFAEDGAAGKNQPKKDAAHQEVEEKYIQVMHKIQQEYGEHLYDEDPSLMELTKDGERRWNKAFCQAYLAQAVDWDTESPDAGLDYALEMMPAHMIRGGMFSEASNLLCNSSFVRGRLFALGRENATRRHIKDCESLFDALIEQRAAGRKKVDARGMIKHAYQTLGSLLHMDEGEFIAEPESPEAIEVGRAQFSIGFSLAEKRSWEAAIAHWEVAQELFVSALGMVEIVAGILYNVGHAYAEMNEYEQALGSLKQCLRIRGAIHGEEHILYARTIQKIGDIFLGMSDYHEAMESYNWALDVMHIEPSHHRIDIGDILENMGNIHYSKGETDEACQCYQDSLRSKQVDLGDDNPELSSIFHHIGNCLSDQGKTEEAIAHFEEAIRLMKLDPDGGGERDADVLTIEGVLSNLNGKQEEGLECYERALQTLVTKVPHKKEKVASLLHLIGCVYLMSGEHKKAMKLFEESLQARRKVLGFVHLDVASTLFNMAFLHQSRNRLDKALKCLEEALKIRQLRLPDSEKVAITHEKIGNLARAIGKTKKAEIAFMEALRIRKLIHGDSHEAVATVLQELGDLMDDLGEYDQAMKYYVEALEIRETRLGPDDLAVGETYYSMGFTLQNNDASDRALQCFEEALSIRKFQLGDDAKEVGDTLNMMGFLQAKRGELDDALSLLWDALRIRKLQEDHVKVSETLKNIGNVHREKQEFELAVECYEECIKIRRAELGNDHEKVADALIAMGNVQSDMDNKDEAMRSYKQALSIRTTRFGEQDESVAAVLQYMGTLEFRAGELDRAQELLEEFVRIRQGNGSEQDGDYVNVLFMMGNIHKMQGNEDEAKKCWSEAYGIFQELGLADGNPQIAQVMGAWAKENQNNQNDHAESNGTHSGGFDDDEDMPEQYQEKSSRPQKGVLSRLTDKVKAAGKKKNRGHQL